MGKSGTISRGLAVAAAIGPEQHGGGMSHHRYDYRYYDSFPYRIRAADEEIASKNPVRKTRGQLRREERQNALRSQGPTNTQFKAAMRQAKQKRGR